MSTVQGHLKAKTRQAEQKRKQEEEAAAIDQEKKRAKLASDAIKLEEAEIPAVFVLAVDPVVEAGHFQKVRRVSLKANDGAAVKLPDLDAPT
eukprot:11411202-Alexandrium_andersonii.AAC.1